MGLALFILLITVYERLENTLYPLIDEEGRISFQGNPARFVAIYYCLPTLDIALTLMTMNDLEMTDMLDCSINH